MRLGRKFLAACGPNHMGLDPALCRVPDAEIAIFEEGAKAANELGVPGVRRDETFGGHDMIPPSIVRLCVGRGFG
jgi:hypothetical protein